MNRRAKLFLPLVVLLAGAALAGALVKLRPPVERREVVTLAPLIRVVTAQPIDVQIKVRSQGTVQPGIESILVAQVPGLIEWVSPQFADGGRFRRGELLLRIEDSDYRLAVSQAEARVAAARTRLELAQAEAEQARLDWADLGQGEPTSLTLREPQLAEARAEVQGAQAALEQARIGLARTHLTASYDGRIRRARVDVGQFVGAGTQLADLFSTEYAEIRLPVAKNDLGFLDVDLGDSSGSETAAVELIGDLGGKQTRWPARVVRAGGEFDPRTRMLPLYARIDDPFGSGPAESTKSNPVLPMGLYVDAEIFGRSFAGITRLPRIAIRDNDQVLIVDGDNQLRFRDVDVLRVDRDEVLVQAGLEAGERVCVSPLETVTDGMAVRVMPPVDQDTGRDIDQDSEQDSEPPSRPMTESQQELL